MSRMLTPEQSLRLKKVLIELSALSSELAEGGVLLQVNRDYAIDRPEWRSAFKAGISLNETVDLEVDG